MKVGGGCGGVFECVGGEEAVHALPCRLTLKGQDKPLWLLTDRVCTATEYCITLHLSILSYPPSGLITSL